MKTTDNEWHEIIYGCEITDSTVRTDNDYLDDEEYSCASFFHYNDQYYNLDQFMRTDEDDIDGIAGMTNTSALGIKLSDCGEAVMVYVLS